MRLRIRVEGWGLGICRERDNLGTNYIVFHAILWQIAQVDSQDISGKLFGRDYGPLWVFLTADADADADQDNFFHFFLLFFPFQFFFSASYRCRRWRRLRQFISFFFFSFFFLISNIFLSPQIWGWAADADADADADANGKYDKKR